MAGECNSSDIRIWDTGTESGWYTLKDHTDSVNQLKFTADSKRLVSASDDGTVRIWDLTDNMSQEEANTSAASCGSVEFSSNGEMVAWLSYDSTVRVCKLASESTFTVLSDPGDVLTGLAFAPDGSLLAVASWDTVRVLETRNWTYHALERHSSRAFDVAFSPDGKHLAVARETDVEIWETSGWQVSVKPNYASADLCSACQAVAFSPDNRFLAYAHDYYIYIIDLHDGYQAEILFGAGLDIQYIVFSADSLIMVSRDSYFGITKTWHRVRQSAEDRGKWILSSVGNNALVSPKALGGGREAKWTIEEGRWIAFDGKRIMYLPDDRQVRKCDIFGDTIAVDSASGLLTILQFRTLDEYLMDLDSSE
jgi:WD40 repeat protein